MVSKAGKRTVWVVVSALLVLVLVWARPETRPEAAAPAHPEALAPTSTAPAPPLHGIEVEIRLSTDGAAQAIPASVRIGIARVSAESRVRHADWERAGEGAGASRVEDLAVVDEWRSAPTRREDDGTVIVGPITLPVTDRYDLEARSMDRLRFYRASFTATSVPEKINPHVAAGLSADLAGQPGDARLQLLRRSESSSAERWQRLWRPETPDVLELFDDAGYPVRSGQIIAPLPPGRYEAVLWVDGVEASRRPIELHAGRIVPLGLSPETLRVAAALASRIVVVPVEAGSQEPILGVTATWRGPAGERALTADPLGRLLLAGADLLAAHEIEVQLPIGLDESGLPRWPSRATLKVSPEDADVRALVGTKADVVRHFEIMPLRWLTLKDARKDDPAPVRPYPVFLLQRWQDNNTWADVGSEHFIPRGGDMAVAIDAPGTYRILRADRPWRVHASTSAIFDSGPSDGESVTLSFSPSRRIVLPVTRPDGSALLHHHVDVVGPHRGMPPVALSTDGGGWLQLEAANVREIFIEPAGMEGSTHRLD